MKIVSNSSRLQLVVSYKLFYKLVIYMIYKYILYIFFILSFIEYNHKSGWD